ncbi:MAG: GlsB/YeaQ/YmgE family stress response membrane protein [Marmoricola sp.]
MGTILWTLIGGTVVGLLGKFVAPGGKDNIPLWLTIICGIAGMLIGDYLYTAVGGSANTSGVDWLRHGVQIIVAAVLVAVAAMVTGRRSA